MSGTLQTYLATATPRAAGDLEAALLRLPEDKRDWSAGGKARTAINMVAECVLMNGGTVELLEKREFPEWDQDGYHQELARLAALPWSELQALLHENTAKVVAAIGTVSDEDLEKSIDMPWGAMTLSSVAAYPFWNMCYHEGQINFIASMLGCLD